jgi:hypothetical protein
MQKTARWNLRRNSRQAAESEHNGWPPVSHRKYGATALSDLDSLPDKVRKQILRKIERLQSGLHGDIKTPSPR